ncbi:MAG: TonB family protein [Kofleriaceae bacterium]
MGIMQRCQIVALSALGHLGLVFALFIASVWRLERLALEAPKPAPLVAPMPPPAASGGGAAPAPVTITPKRKRVDVLVQPTPQREPLPPPRPSDEALGSGEGPATGKDEGLGSPNDNGSCTVDCGEAVSSCGNGVVDPGEACDDGNPRGGDGCSSICDVEPPVVHNVAPTVLEGHWLSGERKIYPPDAVKAAMMRDDRMKSVGVLKVCVDQAGVVSSVGIARSIGYRAYDDRLVVGARAWRFRPLIVNGRAAPFCGVVTFVYVIQ